MHLQHPQQTAQLEELFSFELAETTVTTMEYVRGSGSSSSSNSSCGTAVNNNEFVTGDTVWMGTDTKKVLIYSANCGEMFNGKAPRSGTAATSSISVPQLASCSVPDAVTQIVYHADGMFLSVKNGGLLIFRKRGSDGAWNLKEPQSVTIFSNEQGCQVSGINSLLPINNSVYVASGRKISVLASHSGDVTKTFEVENDSPNINFMTHSGIGLWISMRQSSVISLYHTESLKHLQDINIAANVLRLTSSQFKGDVSAANNKSTIFVTALMASKGLLWVGTNVGIALTIPLPRLEGVPIIGGGISISYHAHFGPITFILPLIPKSHSTSSGQSSVQQQQLQQQQQVISSCPRTTALTITEEVLLKIQETTTATTATTTAVAAVSTSTSTTTTTTTPNKKLTKVSPSNSTASSSSSNSEHQPIVMTTGRRKTTLEKQNSIDSPFSSAVSSRFRAQFASSPIVLRRQRFREAADTMRMSQTLPRSLGSSVGGYFSQSIHSSNASSSGSSQGGSEQNCCDVYGLYGDLIYVKEDYEAAAAAEDGQANIMDSAYESLRRSNPELIPIKVSTLDRRMRMKVARPRSLDLSNWSVDSRSSSLYTASSGSEESMAMRMQQQQQNGGVSRNSSNASRKFQPIELMAPPPQAITTSITTTTTEQSALAAAALSSQTTTAPSSEAADLPPHHSIPDVICSVVAETSNNNNTSNIINNNNMNNSNHLMPATSTQMGTLKRKSVNNGTYKTGAKKDQQLPEIGGKRTIITLTGGRGYINWRQIWCNTTATTAASGGGSGSGAGGSMAEKYQRSGSIPNVVPVYPRTAPNSNDAHVVIWEKKL